MLDRELLDLAQQPLLAVADLADERLRGVAVERRAEARRLALQPLGSSRAFIVASSRTRRRGLHRLDERLGRLERPSSRAKNAIVVSGGMSASAGTRCS